MRQPRGFKIRIELDEVFNRKTQEHKRHWIGSSFQAFAVIDTNDSNFQLGLAADPKNGFEAMPMRDGMWHNFETTVSDGCLENSVPQAGKWVEIWVSTEDKLTSGNLRSIITSRAIAWEGSTAPQSKVTVGSVAAEILDADDNRIIGRFQYKSGTGTVYVGTDAELADADFANICHEVSVGDDFEVLGSGGQSAKCVGGTVIYSLRKGMN